MRLPVVVLVLGFATGVAHAEDAAGSDDGAVPTGGTYYLALGEEAVVLSTPPTMLFAFPDSVDPTSLEAGYRISDAPLYLHAAIGGSTSGYIDARAGLDLRAGGMVKGIFGLDAGYQRDPRMVDAPYSVEGPYIAPRLGLEVGTQKLWVRGVIDWRYTLARAASGHAGSFALFAGHDF